MTNVYQRTVNVLVKFMYYSAGAAIIGMMLITCADVALRYFRMPIPGTYEIVSFLGAIAISFAIAHTSVEQGHVAVSFVVDKLPEKVRIGISAVTGIIGFALFAAISWQSYLYANELWASGEVSLTMKIPFYPVVYGISFSTGMVCLVLLANIVNDLRKVFGK